MQRKNGASRQVLGWIRTDDFYANSIEGVVAKPAKERGAGRKPTGKRRIIRGSVKPDGTWAPATMVHV